VVAIEREHILVQCGGRALLEVSELRFAGRRAMQARDAVNGRLIESGEAFAPAAAG
jgi:methionyl-tRNA formyltransferase